MKRLDFLGKNVPFRVHGTTTEMLVSRQGVLPWKMAPVRDLNPQRLSTAKFAMFLALFVASYRLRQSTASSRLADAIWGDLIQLLQQQLFFSFLVLLMFNPSIRITDSKASCMT
ncbi:hypothetical protein KCU91_g57, partial [Aureobasidium melanogenum]